MATGIFTSVDPERLLESDLLSSHRQHQMNSATHWICFPHSHLKAKSRRDYCLRNELSLPEVNIQNPPLCVGFLFPASAFESKAFNASAGNKNGHPFGVAICMYSWTRRDSNSRPNKEMISFLHV